ncbi:unnamed protein product, partial [Mesorhabditis spiculigera]
MIQLRLNQRFRQSCAFVLELRKNLFHRIFNLDTKNQANKVRDRIPTKKQYDRQLTDVYHKLPPGLRADTLHIFGLPLDVFCEDKKQSPSMMFVKSCFQQFGNITAVHVPGFEQMKKRRAMELSQKSKLEQLNKEVVGDVFLRFETYQGFVNAIESFRNKRWSRVLPDGSERTLDVEVDFDRCGHLTEAAIHERLQEVIRAEREEQAEKQRLIEEQQRRKKEELRLLLLSRIEEEKKELRQYRSLKMLCQAEHIVAGALKRVVEKLEEPASEPESLSEESEPEHEPAPEPEPESEPESAPSPPKQRTISPVFQIQIRADYKFPRAKK